MKLVVEMRNHLKKMVQQRIIGPEKNPLPSALTTFASIFAFSVFFAFLAVTSRWPTEHKRISMNIIVGTSVLTIVGLCILDWSKWVRTHDGQGESNYHILQTSQLTELLGNPKMKYKRNLANTVLSLTLSMFVLLLVYDFKWHEALNHIVLETTEEPVVSDQHRKHLIILQSANHVSRSLRVILLSLSSNERTGAHKLI
jgi:hypothetical protein